VSRILYVEDNEDNVYMLCRRLRARGHTVLVAENGAKGVEAARQELPDLILMDLSLPVLSGWEAACLLKEETSTASIPIIALSAHALDGERQRALEAGCDDFEAKPINMTCLLDKIGRLVRPGAG
jgi:two-component system cell cycle response regulator DivK